MDVNQMTNEPGLNLEFVDEALTLVRDAEAAGILLRILGSIAIEFSARTTSICSKT